MLKKPKINIVTLLVFLFGTLSPFLISFLMGQGMTIFDGITAAFLGVFSMAVFIWWKKRKKSPRPDLLDDGDFAENGIEEFLD